MKTKLFFLKALTLLILFNINIKHAECMSYDSNNVPSLTSSEIHWEDPAYVDGDTYTINIYHGEILHYSAVTSINMITVSLPPTLTSDIKIELIKHKPEDYTSMKVLSIVTLEDIGYRHTIL